MDFYQAIFCGLGFIIFFSSYFIFYKLSLQFISLVQRLIFLAIFYSYRGLRFPMGSLASLLLISLIFGISSIIGNLGAAQYIDLLRVKLNIFLKSPVPLYSISLISGIYLQLYKVFYYNANFFYKERYQGNSFRLDKLLILYIKPQA